MTTKKQAANARGFPRNCEQTHNIITILFHPRFAARVIKKPYKTIMLLVHVSTPNTFDI